MDDNYSVGQALRVVRELAEQEGRKLRLGNPIEALYFMKPHNRDHRKEGYVYPFLVIGEDLGGCYMCWDDKTNMFVPCKNTRGTGFFCSRARVFVVEDL